MEPLTPGLHPRLRVVLERCLEKELADRYRDIAERASKSTR